MTRRKRANGEGSLYQRAEDGLWVATVSYRDAHGQRRRHTVYARRQADVKRKVAEVRARIEQGAPARDARVKVGVFGNGWCETALAASARKESTKENYATVVRAHLVPGPFGEISLDRLQPSDVEALIVAKRAEGKSAATVRLIYTVLRAVLDTAVRDGLLARNPAAAVKRPAAAPKEATYLTPDQVTELLAAAREERLYALVVLLAGTGLRRGEGLALHWSDVDLEAGVLRVRATLARVGGRLVLTEPKSERSRRTVALSAPVVAELRAHRARQAQERLAAGAAWVANDRCSRPRSVRRRTRETPPARSSRWCGAPDWSAAGGTSCGTHSRRP
jgi:integrase